MLPEADQSTSGNQKFRAPEKLEPLSYKR